MFSYEFRLARFWSAEQGWETDSDKTHFLLDCEALEALATFSMLDSISFFLSFNLTERFWRFLFHVTTGADGIVGHIRERIRLFLIVWLVELRGLFPHLLSDFLHCDRLDISASVSFLLEKFFITL